jgi:hypothetical protein
VDKARPFDIPKREVWEAFKKVKENQGAAGVDGAQLRWPAESLLRPWIANSDVARRLVKLT